MKVRGDESAVDEVGEWAGVGGPAERVLDAVGDDRGVAAVGECDRLEEVLVSPEAVGAADLGVDEPRGRVERLDERAPAHGQAAERDAVVDDRARAHGDGRGGDDPEVEPRRGELLEVLGGLEEGEDLIMRWAGR